MWLPAVDPATWESTQCVGTMHVTAPEVPRPDDVKSGKFIHPYKIELVEVRKLQHDLHQHAHCCSDLRTRGHILELGRGHDRVTFCGT